MFVLSMLDCKTARHLWSFIQSSTGRAKETKLPDWFADHMKRLLSYIFSCGDIEHFCSTFNFVVPLPLYVVSHLGNPEPNLKPVFFFANWRLHSPWDKILNGIKDLFTFLIFYYNSIKYSKIIYYPKGQKTRFILFISLFS